MTERELHIKQLITKAEKEFIPMGIQIKVPWLDYRTEEEVKQEFEDWKKIHGI